ncbi:hypothetical protein HanRHA438_Chr14g0634381 [Helianthus annuus]|nr:hypothetical protein HanHA300_Chr14g0510231 [Helianthus annuus]KAJ0466781.1 hypothetical protein HanIR_Chr14g0676001 [Helianthus annuus]KAJ0852102.1 hypothetical protein HanRHA438_Chr14g0634381 [Helianthus annuus]
MSHYNNTPDPQTPHTRFYTRPLLHQRSSPSTPTDTRRSNPPYTPYKYNYVPTHRWGPPA